MKICLICCSCLLICLLVVGAGSAAPYSVISQSADTRVTFWYDETQPVLHWDEHDRSSVSVIYNTPSYSYLLSSASVSTVGSTITLDSFLTSMDTFIAADHYSRAFMVFQPTAVSTVSISADFFHSGFTWLMFTDKPAQLSDGGWGHKDDCLLYYWQDWAFEIEGVNHGPVPWDSSFPYSLRDITFTLDPTHVYLFAGGVLSGDSGSAGRVHATLDFNPVPEPPMVLQLATGLFGIMAFLKRRQRKGGY